MKKNIVLIGMSGCGKSTVGVVLAKMLGMNFTDTDILISVEKQAALPQILEKEGVCGLLAAENEIGKTLVLDNCVAATGGSMVLSKDAVDNLKKQAVFVWIKVESEEIKRRILPEIEDRGIAAEKGESLESIYDKRQPYYAQYADLEIEGGESADDTAKKIIRALKLL